MSRDCERTPEQLEARRDGVLGEPGARRLAAHLDACDDCRRDKDATEPLQLFSGLTEQPLPPGIAPYLLGGVRAEEGRRRWPGLRLAAGWLEPVPALAALAAAALLVVFWAVRGPSVSPGDGGPVAAELWLPPHALTTALETVEDIRSPTAEVVALSLPGDEGPTELILIVDRNMDL